MGQQIETLARFAAETQLEDIPVPVREHAKRVLLDTLGVILGGSARPEVMALRIRLAANNSAGATVYAPGAPVHDARTAALLNGIAGRAIELCEGLRLASGQAAIQIVPGALAMGSNARQAARPCSPPWRQATRSRRAWGLPSRRAPWRTRIIRP